MTRVPDDPTQMVGTELEDTRRTRDPPVYEVTGVEEVADAEGSSYRFTLERVGGDDQAVEERTHTRDEFQQLLEEGTYVETRN